MFLQKIKKIAVPITGITRLLDVWFSFFSILEDIRIAFDVCEKKKRIRLVLSVLVIHNSNTLYYCLILLWAAAVAAIKDLLLHKFRFFPSHWPSCASPNQSSTKLMDAGFSSFVKNITNLFIYFSVFFLSLYPIYF